MLDIVPLPRPSVARPSSETSPIPRITPLPWTIRQSQSDSGVISKKSKIRSSISNESTESHIAEPPTPSSNPDARDYSKLTDVDRETGPDVRCPNEEEGQSSLPLVVSQSTTDISCNHLFPVTTGTSTQKANTDALQFSHTVNKALSAEDIETLARIKAAYPDPNQTGGGTLSRTINTNPPQVQVAGPQSPRPPSYYTSIPAPHRTQSSTSDASSTSPPQSSQPQNATSSVINQHMEVVKKRLTSLSEIPSAEDRAFTVDQAFNRVKRVFEKLGLSITKTSHADVSTITTQPPRTECQQLMLRYLEEGIEELGLIPGLPEEDREFQVDCAFVYIQRAFNYAGLAILRHSESSDQQPTTPTSVPSSASHIPDGVDLTESFLEHTNDISVMPSHGNVYHLPGFSFDPSTDLRPDFNRVSGGSVNAWIQGHPRPRSVLCEHT